MSAIIPFSKDDPAFGPEDASSMADALQEVCEALKVPEWSNGERENIAKRIVELARWGERNPERLRDRVVQQHNLSFGVDSDKRLHDLLQALPAAIYMTDAKGRITFYNKAAATLWGCRPALGSDEWCGSWRLFRPDGTSLPHDQCPMAMALKENRAIDGMEAAAERPDGTRVPFMAFPSPLHDPSGKVVGAVNMLVDITERKRSEELERLLVSIVESSDDAIISKDLNGIITSWNKGAEQLFNYAAEEVIGKHITLLFPPNRLEEEKTIIERIRSGERIEHYETVRRRKDGSLIEISLTVSPVKNAQGKIIGASKIARDITERKRSEVQIAILARQAEPPSQERAASRRPCILPNTALGPSMTKAEIR